MLNPYSHQYSRKYKVKRYIRDNSMNDLRKVGLKVCEGITLVAMFAMMFLVPALFH